MALSKRERKALLRYMRWVANEMELRDWELELDPDQCAEDVAGHCQVTGGLRHARISVASNFREHSPEEQRDTIVHELVHIHLDGSWRMVQHDLGDALGKPVYYVFCDSYRRAMELGVDALSKSIAKHLPLIEWPKAKK